MPQWSTGTECGAWIMRTGSARHCTRSRDAPRSHATETNNHPNDTITINVERFGGSLAMGSKLDNRKRRACKSQVRKWWGNGAIQMDWWNAWTVGAQNQKTKQKNFDWFNKKIRYMRWQSSLYRIHLSLKQKLKPREDVNGTFSSFPRERKTNIFLRFFFAQKGWLAQQTKTCTVFISDTWLVECKINGAMQTNWLDAWPIGAKPTELIDHLHLAQDRGVRRLGKEIQKRPMKDDASFSIVVSDWGGKSGGEIKSKMEVEWIFWQKINEWEKFTQKNMKIKSGGCSCGSTERPFNQNTYKPIHT